MKKLVTLGILLLSLGHVNAQTWADQLVASGPCTPIVAVTCPSGVENPGFAADVSKDNYAVLKTNLGVSLIESTSFIELGFSKNAPSGSEFGIFLEKFDQNVNIDVIDNLTAILYDESGNEVFRNEDLSLDDLGVLGGGTNRQVTRFKAPIGNYLISKVRLELKAVVGVTQLLGVFGVFHQTSCPAIVANKLIGSLRTTNPGGAVDQDTNTFATLSLPLAIGTSASITLGFEQPAQANDFVGFEISKNNTLLQLGVIDSIDIVFYGKDSTELIRRSDFNLADLIAVDQLGGVLGPLFGINGSLNPKFILGFTVPSNLADDVYYVQLELNSTIGLLLDINVHRALYVSQLKGLKITADRIGIFDGVPVTLTASSGYNNYYWTSGQLTQSIAVTEPGFYTVFANRFDGCQVSGTINVRSLECSANGRVFADSVFDFGNCIPQSLLLCPSGVDNPEFAVDNDSETFARLNAMLSVSLIESTAFLDLSFKESGDPGSDVGVIIQRINQNLNADVISNVTIYVYDEQGNEVMKRSGVNLQNVGLLSGAGTQAAININTPIGNYRIKRIRVELVGGVAVLQDLGVYGMYYDCACPPIMADTVISSNNTLNASLAVDSDQSNYALMTIPVNIAGSANLRVGFTNSVSAGDYVGFQVAPENDLLSLDVINDFTVTVYDNLGVARQVFSDFNVANVVAAEQLGGTLGGLLGAGGAGTTPYVVGFQTASGPYVIGSIELSINSVLGVLTSLRVYNAFSLTQLQGVKITASDSISCNGNAVVLTAPAGFSNYLWSNGETTQVISVTTPGMYSVTIGRADGCTLNSGSYFIQSRTLTATFNSFEPNCQVNNGASSVTIAGGSGSYGYVWSTGDTTRTITNLGPGTYTVDVLDRVYGCFETFSITLENSDVKFVGYVRNADCGTDNGAIFLTLPAGSTVVWSNGATTKAIYNLVAGQYTATVTLPNGCFTSETYTVLDYSNMQLSAVVQNANCILDNGAIDLTVGVSGIFSYLWSNDATTEDISNLAPNMYSVIVTNQENGCQDMLRDTVSDFGAPVINLVDSKEETCARQENGRLEISYIPNNSNFTVVWSNGVTGTKNELLGPGVYVVKVTNGLGCEGVRFYELVARDTLKVGLSTAPSVCEPPFTGIVTSNVTGGRAPFKYLYSTGDTAFFIEKVAPGTYDLRVTDFNGCENFSSAVVQRDASCDTTIVNPPVDPRKPRTTQLVTPNDDGFNDVFETELTEDYPNNLVEIYTRDGALVYKSTNYNNRWKGTYKSSSTQLPDGTYFWVFKGFGSDAKEFRGFVVIKN